MSDWQPWRLWRSEFYLYLEKVQCRLQQCKNFLYYSAVTAYLCPSQAASWGEELLLSLCPFRELADKRMWGWFFLCVMWVLVSWNLNRCGRNLITSTSKQALEQRQPWAPVFSDWRQMRVLRQNLLLVVMILLFINLAVFLLRFTTPVLKL